MKGGAIRGAMLLNSFLRQRYLVTQSHSTLESLPTLVRTSSSTSSGRPFRGRGGKGGGGKGGVNSSGSSSGGSTSSTSRGNDASKGTSGYKKSTSSSPSSISVIPIDLQIVANDDIARKVGGVEALVRVIVAEDKSNLGVISVTDALLIAKSKGLDLVMIATPPGSPPVCRLISLAAYQAERLEAAEKEKEREAEAKRALEVLAQEARKQKEIRLTTRTDDHDLGVKNSRIVEFLRSGHSVRVSVTFSKSTSAWVKEEPHRRAMFAAVVRAVMASGAGYIDANSIQGSGANLVGVFSANKHISSSSTTTTTTTKTTSSSTTNSNSDSTAPKGSAEWEKVLNRLSDPRGLRPDEGVPSFVKPALQSPTETISTSTGIGGMSTSSSLSSSSSSTPSASKINSSTLPPDLPPVEMLIRSARRISPRSSSTASAGGGAGGAVPGGAVPSPSADDEDRGIAASSMGDVRLKIAGGKAGGGSSATSGVVVKGRKGAIAASGSRGGGMSSNSRGGGGGGGGRKK